MTVKTLTLENSLAPVWVRVMGQGNGANAGKRGGRFCRKSGCRVDWGGGIFGERVFKEVIKIK